MGFFDLLGKAVSAVVSEAQSQQQRVYKQVERDEKRFSSKSDDELKQIAKDESKAPLERAVASKVYKDRHWGGIQKWDFSVIFFWEHH